MLWVAQASESNSVPLEAIAITAGAVVLAAVIAAVAAHLRLQATLRDNGERLQDQLDAERERAQDQLDAERQRLDRQLDHERELTDLAELRALLDGLMADVLTLYDDYTAMTMTLDSQLRDDQPATEQAAIQADLKVANEKVAFHTTGQKVVIHSLRISARLPADHSVVKAHSCVTSVLHDMPDPDKPGSSERLDEMRQAEERLWQAQAALIEAARSTIGSRIPSS